MEEFEDDEIVKKIMHVMREAPHGTIYTYEGLEMILIMAAYDQDISVAFIDDGVYALKKGQNTEDIEIKGFAKTFGALDGYDVEKLFKDREKPYLNLMAMENCLCEISKYLKVYNLDS